MTNSLPAFAGYGIELEYAIVDARSLDIRPLAAPLLRAMRGVHRAPVERSAIDWSNELVQHVVEIKNVAPVPSLEPLVSAFRDAVADADRRIADYDARLMPTGMHPWMDAHAADLWTLDGSDIYRAFDRLFDCRRHGWANLQSMHVNLPFADDREFARPRADLAIAALLAAVVRAQYEERWQPQAAQQAMKTSTLATLLQAGMRDADQALFTDADYLRLFGLHKPAVRAGDVWAHLVAECGDTAASVDPAYREPIETIMTQGPLARRILRVLDGATGRRQLAHVYRRLCDCLACDELFFAGA